ncbi:MAG: OmpH family outer membrane protein [Victivallaceae bacterium]
MKQLKLLLLAGFAALALLTSAAAEELKIAVVDMDQVFSEYHKTPGVEKMLSERAGAIRATIEAKNEELKAQEAQLLKLKDEANNIALDNNARAQKSVEFTNLLKTLQENKLALDKYTQEKSAEYRKLEAEKRNEIIKDIVAEVQARAVTGNYTLVLDKSGKTINGISSIVYNKSSIDITKEVIRQLNRMK